MNWIDRMVEYVSPAAAVRRAYARMSLNMARSYDAGKVGRRTAGWHATNGSANAEIAPQLSRIRARGRDIVRNNEYGRSAIRALVANTIGDGITVKSPDNGLWEAWCDQCDYDGQLNFNGLLELAVRHRYTDGEVLIRLHHTGLYEGLSVPLQLQVLEADHLDTSKTGELDNGHFVIAGVEFDRSGRRCAYWIFQTHPGEIAGMSWKNGMDSIRVAARYILHYYRKERASQVRGMSELAVALMRLRDVADYEQAELVRKKIEACFAVFIRSDNGGLNVGQQGKTASGQRTETLAPGMITRIDNADAIEFASPSQSGGYEGYTNTQLHAIAAGTGVMYSQMTGDLSKFNYSSYRAGLVEFRQIINAEQWLALVPMLINPICWAWQKSAILSGALRGKPSRMSVTMPKKAWVDPVKDVMAAKEAQRAGMKSVSESIRELGGDPDAVLAEIIAERQQYADAGILFDSDAAVSERLIKITDVMKTEDS
ncbi:phage portal protein [Oxalobacter formigenes]|uniref:phage portal protein n=1 Tax=Oxalobacter formigenes TaxID=847 RepID=UPI00241ED8E9|nr:phage portal protein [Oxalobacter formigenes]